MSEDKNKLADEATVVMDEVAPEEKANEELVAKVAKTLGRDEYGDDIKQEDTAVSDDENTPPEEGPEQEPEGEKEEEKPALSYQLQARAEEAGISQELAAKLHESGQLEETLAAFDRAMVARFDSSKEKTKEPEGRDDPQQAEDIPELDPEDYDELIIKRDAYHKRRIDTLEAQLAELVKEKQEDFDARFDQLVDNMELEDLFGKGSIVPSDKQENRSKLFKAYQKVCEVFDADPQRCDPEVAARALALVYPEHAKGKKDLQQTVDRARDASGKFIPSAKNSGAPPAKSATSEEAHDELVSNVSAYLKKQGVQMSGI